MVTTGEFKANVTSMHVKNIQERKLYTGEEKAMGVCCTETKYPKSSELRSLQTVMLCRGLQTTAEMLFASKSHQSSASFMSGLSQCLVENKWFYGTLGKEQWKLWIFSRLIFELTLLVSANRSQSCCSALTPSPQSCSKNCPELVLLSNANGVSQLETGKENAIFFFFLFYVQPIFIARLRGLDFKVLKIFKFNRKGKNSPNIFVRVSYFFPPGLIVWISPTAVWHCKAFWGWQMLFKIKFCSSLQYCACPRITFL